ncbi:MAG: hypothetical protein CMF61_03350 [Magnetococcales bacterium]|nr:hypothetical protein [Magnetococcales bacterium]
MKTDNFPFPFYLSKARDQEQARLRAWATDPEHFKMIARVQQAPRLVLGNTATHSKPNTVSIQASEMHYCEPRKTIEFHYYSSFEVGFPCTAHRADEILEPWADEDAEGPSGIYINVPVAAVQEYVDYLGGITGYLSNYKENTIEPLHLTEQDITYYSLYCSNG